MKYLVGVCSLWAKKLKNGVSWITSSTKATDGSTMNSTWPEGLKWTMNDWYEYQIKHWEK